MRRFVVSCLKIILDVGFWCVVAGAGFLGAMAGLNNPAVPHVFGSQEFGVAAGAAIGLVGGFLLACLMFGMFYLLFQIEENTRRGGQFFEVLGKRMHAREMAPAVGPENPDIDPTKP